MTRQNENNQRQSRRNAPNVQEHEAEQRSVARDGPGVREHEAAQQAAARARRTFDMACKYVDGKYIFHQACGLWNAPCVHGCGYLHLSSSTARLSSTAEDTGGTSMSEERSNEVPNQKCVICLRIIDVNDHDASVRSPCNNIFHRDCLLRWTEEKVRF